MLAGGDTNVVSASVMSTTSSMVISPAMHLNITSSGTRRRIFNVSSPSGSTKGQTPLPLAADVIFRYQIVQSDDPLSLNWKGDLPDAVNIFIQTLYVRYDVS